MSKKKKDKLRLKEMSALSEKGGMYFNRELSWIKFNERILKEAADPANPLIERVNYLGIVASNLDEFFMVRVPEYQRSPGIDKSEYAEQIGTETPLEQIYSRVIVLMRYASQLWRFQLTPELETAGITIINWSDCTPPEKKELKTLIKDDQFTILRGDRYSAISHENYLHGFALLVETLSGRAVIPIQETINRIGRFLPVGDRKDTFLLAEDLLRKHAETLFPDEDIYVIYPIRLTRDSDMELKGDDADDIIAALKAAPEELAKRMPSRLETPIDMPFGYTALLVEALALPPALVYDVKGMLAHADLKDLPVNHPEHRFKPFTPGTPEGMQKNGDIFAAIADRDRLLFTPYQTFDTLINFLTAAADDPAVQEISMTLYRLGARSPIADALIQAANNGKKVTAVVELKASFDEERNFAWSRKLSESGVKVIHGIPGLKVHAKCCLVTRQENGLPVYYATLSTGNYNAKTAAIYSDLSLFTADKDICRDLQKLFATLSGEKNDHPFTRLLVSPDTMTTGLLDRINRETKSEKGHIILKLNSLSDKDIINALYTASQAGVKIELCIRGICMLRPGVPDLSENISVISVVGRFLEHSRIFYFKNNKDPELFIGSPDMMPRNLHKRVELLCPILDPRLRHEIISELLPTWLQDHKKGYILDASGRYIDPVGEGESSQEQFIGRFREKITPVNPKD